jgi:uncharacterized protein
MPVAPPVSYPGVYIQEVPSDVRTIVPVDTATTAFVGRALRGPVNEPIVINSWADFESIFGGLWLDNMLGYAVRSFYQNGGSKGVIVRLNNPAPEDDTADASAVAVAATGALGTLTLTAADPGAWGNRLAARVDDVDAKLATPMATRYNVNATDLFNFSVRDLGTGRTEYYPNVTVTDGPRRLDKVLEGQSTLIRAGGTLGGTAKRPSASAAPATGKQWWEVTSAYTPLSKGTDGAALAAASFSGSQADKTGIYALDNTNIFNLLCIPPFAGDGSDVPFALLDEAAQYCRRKRAMLLVDPPSAWTDKKKAVDDGPDAVLTPTENAILYFPRIKMPNLLRDNQIEEFTPSGAVAGIMARTDGSRGVWKAPAGIEATLSGVSGLTVPLTDAENGELNPLGINCLRTLPAAGHVVWGARTTVGDDRLASQWKYIPVRRTALFIEETLYRNTQWAVFEPNDEPLWSQLRLNIGVFMHDLFRQGAFQGGAPKDAYFVKCDASTTTQSDIDRGIVNVIVGFAPLKPAEFVVIYIQQIAGQLAA